MDGRYDLCHVVPQDSHANTRSRSKIRTRCGPTRLSSRRFHPLPQVRDDGERVPPADEEPAGVVLAEEAGLLLEKPKGLPGGALNRWAALLSPRSPGNRPWQVSSDSSPRLPGRDSRTSGGLIPPPSATPSPSTMSAPGAWAPSIGLLHPSLFPPATGPAGQVYLRDALDRGQGASRRAGRCPSAMSKTAWQRLMSYAR